MKRLQGVLLVLVLLSAVSVTSADSPPFSGPVAPLPGPFVSFEIYTDGWALSRADKSYVEGGPISIRCVWRNNGKKTVLFFFQEKNRDFPTGLKAKIQNEKGRVLTALDGADRGFWSVDVLSSSLLQSAPEDLMSLEPGKEVSRAVPLDHIVAGPALRELKPGRYKVQLMLGDTLSNELEIRVARDKADRPATSVP